MVETGNNRFSRRRVKNSCRLNFSDYCHSMGGRGVGGDGEKMDVKEEGENYVTEPRRREF